MNALFRTIILSGLLISEAIAQQAKIVPWSADPANPSPAYRPEPILFVHGINANDSGWNTVMSALQGMMNTYQRPSALPPSTGLNATQYPFLHTFNYGDYPATTFGLNPKSFDTIRWNAWAADRNSLSLTNPYTGAVTGHPTDNRQTLDERINGRPGEFPGIREAYRPGPGADPPQIVIVAHSMGGLLSHYYLLNKPTDHGVRRLVTMATPHLGSHVANYRGTFV